jgi:ribonuclease P protein component
MARGFALKKIFRIRKRKDFVRISRFGFFYRSNSIVVQCDSGDSASFRVGFTASRKVGGAVERNRCKRRMRAAADVVLKDLGVFGVDYILIAKKSARTVGWNDLLDEMKTALRFLNNKMIQKPAIRLHS